MALELADYSTEGSPPEVSKFAAATFEREKSMGRQETEGALMFVRAQTLRKANAPFVSRYSSPRARHPAP